jgi:DNA polymerase
MIACSHGPAFDVTGENIEALGQAKNIAGGCGRCDLFKNATHLVFGEGPSTADVVMVGEQPGDKEDLAARPFIGPAGRLRDSSLQEADVDRSRCYVTNAARHFKYSPCGKRRIHAKPNIGEVKACAWWLATEMRLIRPKLLVALGATAAYSLLGKTTKEIVAKFSQRRADRPSW